MKHKLILTGALGLAEWQLSVGGAAGTGLAPELLDPILDQYLGAR